MMSSGEIKWLMKSKVEKGLKYHQVLKKKWVLSIKVNWTFKNKDQVNNFQVQYHEDFHTKQNKKWIK